jgi:hypothetical protein
MVTIGVINGVIMRKNAPKIRSRAIGRASSHVCIISIIGVDNRYTPLLLLFTEQILVASRFIETVAVGVADRLIGSEIRRGKTPVAEERR